MFTYGRAAVLVASMTFLASCAFNHNPAETASPVGTNGTGGATVPDASIPDRIFIGTPDSGTGPCTNLRCQQASCTSGPCKTPACSPGVTTTVSGTVYDPAGKVPLYNVLVYVPNSPLAALSEGASCDCETSVSGNPIVTATTDSKGQFTLTDVPVGTNIPLVIQVGKWRRETSIPAVAACSNTVADATVTRLPKNRTEGHVPKIALTTGGADALECLLRKIGIEDAEFTPEADAGRVNLFAGGNHNGRPMQGTSAGTNAYGPALNGGAQFTDAEVWWESGANLAKYDIILHSCEGVPDTSDTNKSTNARQALQAYADAGGRVFASHWHNYWIEHGPAPWPTVATFNHQGNPRNPFTSTVDTSFPKGAAMADWLGNVGASTTPGQLVIQGAKHTVDSVDAMLSQRWIYSDAPMSVQYFSFNAPVSANKQCGKVVFSDLHVSSGNGGGDTSAPAKPFPSGCITSDLSPQEKALEFMLFDLSTCVSPVIIIP